MTVPGSDLFVEGEHMLGSYHAEIARLANGRWSPTVPPLYATVSNRRLILQPQTRKKYAPASIPGKVIQSVDPIEDLPRGVRIALKSGHEINLIVRWGSSTDFINDLRSSVVVVPARTYVPPLPVNDLQKLIEFVQTL